jgi:hypothetical protein
VTRLLCRIGLHERIDGDVFRETLTPRTGLTFCRWRFFVVCVHCGNERISWLSGDWRRCRDDHKCGEGIVPFKGYAAVPHVKRDVA